MEFLTGEKRTGFPTKESCLRYKDAIEFDDQNGDDLSESGIVTSETGAWFTNRHSFMWYPLELVGEWFSTT